MSGTNLPPADEPAPPPSPGGDKKALKLPITPPVELTTASLGQVEVHPLRVKDLTRLSSLRGENGGDDHAVGLALIGAVTNVKGAEERGLSESQLAKLLPPDLKMLASKIAEMNSWTLEVRDDNASEVANLGKAFRNYVVAATQPMVEALRRAQEQISEPMKQLNAVISGSTKTLIAKNMGLNAELQKLLGQANWSDKLFADREKFNEMFRSMAGATELEKLRSKLTGATKGSPLNAESTTENAPNLRSKSAAQAYAQSLQSLKPLAPPQLDLSDSPAWRTARGVEALRGNLATLLELNKTTLQLHTSTNQLASTLFTEFAAKAVKDHDAATRNFWIAIAAIVVSCLMSAGAMWQASTYKAENDKQQDRMEQLSRDQLKSIEALAAARKEELKSGGAKTREVHALREKLPQPPPKKSKPNE
jgi:hypothetical protein